MRGNGKLADGVALADMVFRFSATSAPLARSSGTAWTADAEKAIDAVATACWAHPDGPPEGLAPRLVPPRGFRCSAGSLPLPAMLGHT